MNFHALWGFLVLAYIFCKNWYAKLEPILIPLIKDVEERAAKGTINLNDRKAILMEGLDIAQQQKILKLNFVERIIVSKIVDIIAQKLPDITVSQNASSIIDKAVTNLSGGTK